MTRIFFSRKYLAYHLYKPILIEEKIQKAQSTVFWDLKCSYLILKVSRALVTNQRVMAHISCNFVSISDEMLLKLWPITMYIYLQQALPRIVIHRTQVAKKKWKLQAWFSPMKENRVHQTKISTETDKGGFSPAIFRSRLEQKPPFTEYLVCCILFCFLWRNVCYEWVVCSFLLP